MSAPTRASAVRRSRLEHLDAVRGWAILLMIFIHTVRGVLLRAYKHADQVDASTWLDRGAVAARAFLFTTEPYISALFLTVSGFAMVATLPAGDAVRPGWYRHRLLRGLQLALLSWAIFWFHAGVNPPYPFLSAEILYTIGLGIAATCWLVPAGRLRWPGLLGLSALFVALTLFAEGNPDHPAARLAQGPGAHLPNLLFFPLGIVLALAWRSGRADLRRGILVGGILLVSLYHGYVAPLVQLEREEQGETVSAVEALFNRPFGRIVSDRHFVVDARFGSTYDLKWLAHAVGLRETPPARYHKVRSFWNKKLVLMPYLAGWMCLTFGLAWLPFWQRRRRLRRLAEPLFLLGRNPRHLYHFHHAVKAAGVARFGGNRWGPAATAAAIVAMVGLCVGLAWGREGWRRRRAMRSATSSGDSRSGGTG